MIGVTEALHKTLHGIDNSLDKEKRERIKDVCLYTSIPFNRASSININCVEIQKEMTMT